MFHVKHCCWNDWKVSRKIPSLYFFLSSLCCLICRCRILYIYSRCLKVFRSFDIELGQTFFCLCVSLFPKPFKTIG